MIRKEERGWGEKEKDGRMDRRYDGFLHNFSHLSRHTQTLSNIHLTEETALTQNTCLVAAHHG